MAGSPGEVRRASVDDAATVGVLLHDFNVEFDTPTDAADVIAARFARLVDGGRVVALLAAEHGLAVVSFRPVLYADGPVAILDELYVRPGHRDRGIGAALLAGTEVVARERGAGLVEINVDGDDHDARRFYERHGYRHTDPGRHEPGLYYSREL